MNLFCENKPSGGKKIQICQILDLFNWFEFDLNLHVLAHN
jgi:hypothetical protein